MSISIPDEFFRDRFSVAIEQREVFRLQGYTRPEDKPDQRVLELYFQMMEVAKPLLEPKGFISFHIIESIQNHTINLQRKVVLTGKNIARTFRGADVLCSGLVTIGPALEEKVRDLFDENNLAAGLMLDSIGSEAAEGAAIYVDNLISDMATSQSWRRTPRMSPGYGSFDVNEQKNLFELVDHQRVGVTLTPSSIMVPQKSVSFIVGCGQNVRYFDNLSPCRICDVKDCPVRNVESERCQQ